MNLVRLRLSDYIVTLNGDDWPLRYSHSVASIGFLIEVRINNIPTACAAAYVSGSLVRDGESPQYAGKGQLSSYTEAELYRYISMEAFGVAACFNVPAWHIWPLLEQFPDFSEAGVKISDAQAFEEPIRDLLARGATHQEVINSLDISRELYEFVAREKLPAEEPMLQEAQSVEESGDW